MKMCNVCFLLQDIWSLLIQQHTILLTNLLNIFILYLDHISFFIPGSAMLVIIQMQSHNMIYVTSCLCKLQNGPDYVKYH